MAPTAPYQLLHQATAGSEVAAPPGYQAATVSFIWWSGDDSYMYVAAGDRRHFCRLKELSNEEENSRLKSTLTKGARINFRVDDEMDEVVIFGLPESAIRHRK